MHPNLAERFTPIFEAISVIQNALADKRLEDFKDDQFLRLAGERAVGIVSETSRLIPEEIKAQRSDIDWPRLAGLGHYLREHYYEIEPQWVWEVVFLDLPPLKEFAARIITQAAR
jgi:uncharacterized protein with HEPN domain